MRIREHLSEHTKDKMSRIKGQRKKRHKKEPLKEKLSNRDLKRLMWDGDTYERGKGGAIRRK